MTTLSLSIKKITMDILQVVLMVSSAVATSNLLALVLVLALGAPQLAYGQRIMARTAHHDLLGSTAR